MRIQVLPLPLAARPDGEHEEPFGLIVDQYPPGGNRIADVAEWQRFRDECGALAVVVTEETVDVVTHLPASTLEVQGDAREGGADFAALVDRVREIAQAQGMDGNWDQSPYMRGLRNGLVLALAILEDSEPEFRGPPEGGYLEDRPRPDMSGPEYAPVAPAERV